MSSVLQSIGRPAATLAAKGLIVFLHGLGSNEQDLISLADFVDPGFHVYSLRAPLEYSVVGYKWFSLDVSLSGISYNLQEARESLERVIATVKDLQTNLNVPPEDTVLAGFSQGAMLSLGVFLANSDLVRFAWLMSGASIPELKTIVQPRKEEAYVLVQHGSYDEIVDVVHGRDVQKLLAEVSSVDVTYLEYPMGHNISQESIQDARNWLSAHFQIVK